MKTLLLVTLSCSFLLTWVTAAEQTQLDALRSKYDVALNKVQTEFSANLEACDRQYLRSLEKLADGVQASGDLQGLIQVKEEIKLFKEHQIFAQTPADKKISSITKTQTSYRGALAKIERSKDKQTALLMESYIKRLQALQKKLVSQDLLDEALKVKESIAEKKAEHTALRIRLTQTTKSNGSRQPLRPSKPIPKATPPTSIIPIPSGKQILLILTGSERETALTACKELKLRNDVENAFDHKKKSYKSYHAILCGSNMMDYWGGKEKKDPEAFRHIDRFVRDGGHLIVFGAYNGRNMHHLKPYGIRTGFNHCDHFEENPGKTELFFKGREEIVPPDKKMRSCGHFYSSQPHTILLKRGSCSSMDAPAIITQNVDKGRLTLAMVEPNWKKDLWLIDVMLNWIARGSPMQAE